MVIFVKISSQHIGGSPFYSLIELLTLLKGSEKIEIISVSKYREFYFNGMLQALF